MSKAFKILYKGASVEIEEKKSRFIAYIEPVNTEEEAAAFIERIKKMNWDATHNCTAAVIGANNEFTRCSDDGEPGGTAGKPMLEVLLREEIHNAAVVVTRYFGGTLLGTGGLVRAYQRAVKEGLGSCEILKKRMGAKIVVETDYNGIGKLGHIASKLNVFVINTEYGENVISEYMVPEEDIRSFINQITETTSGKAVIKTGDIISYAIAGEKLIL